MTPFNKGYQAHSLDENEFPQGTPEYNHWNDGFAVGKKYRGETIVSESEKSTETVQTDVIQKESHIAEESDAPISLPFDGGFPEHE